MKSIYSMLSVLCLAILMTSCRSAYMPNVANTPLLSEKGEAQVAIHYGTSGINPQIAYAFSDHIGAMLNANFLKNENNDQVNNYGEIGIGYFMPFAEKGRFEVFAGYGIGDYYTHDSFKLEIPEIHSGTINRFFIQPSIGFSSEIFEGSFTPRLVHVNVDDISGKGSGTYLEPIITAKVGYKFIKTVFQVGLNLKIGSNNPYYLNQNPLIVSFGLQLNINQLFNTK